MVRSRPAFVPPLLAALAVALLLPAPLRAERQGVFEIGAAAGYRFSGRLEGREDPATGERLSDLYINGALTFGADAGYWVNRTVMLELLWTHQSSEVENRERSPEEERFRTDVMIDDILLGAVIHGGRAYDRIRWSGGFHVGGTAFRFDENTETRLGFGASAGTRSPLSARVRLRTFARVRWAYLDRSEDFICDAAGNCYRFPRSNWLSQWELGAGLHYVF